VATLIIIIITITGEEEIPFPSNNINSSKCIHINNLPHIVVEEEAAEGIIKIIMEEEAGVRTMGVNISCNQRRSNQPSLVVGIIVLQKIIITYQAIILIIRTKTVIITIEDKTFPEIGE